MHNQTTKVVKRVSWHRKRISEQITLHRGAFYEKTLCAVPIFTCKYLQAFKVSYASHRVLSSCWFTFDKGLLVSMHQEPLDLGRGTLWKLALEGDPMKTLTSDTFLSIGKANRVRYTNHIYYALWATRKLEGQILLHKIFVLALT